MILAATCLLVLSLPLVRGLIVPGYREWSELRLRVASQQEDLQKLDRYLANKNAVDEQFRQLGPEVEQQGGEEVVLSQYLRDLETTARQPGDMLVNMNPLPVRREGSYRIYPVKLTLAGRLADLIRFAAAASSRGARGIESFSLRGVQGNENVECSMSMWMVRVTPDPSPQGLSQRAQETVLSHAE